MKVFIDKNNKTHLVADNGKILARANNLNDTYNEVVLGLYNHDGVVRMDTEEDFIEIDEEENNNEE